MDVDRAYGGYPDLSNASQALVIFFRNIGDVLLSSPVFTVLKRQHPHIQIDALVNEGTEAMLKGHPSIRHIHVFRRSAKKEGLMARLREETRLHREIRNQGYDLSLSLGGGDRPQILATLAGIPIRVSSGRTKTLFFGRVPLTTHAVRHAGRGRHYVEHHLDNLRRIGVFPSVPEDISPILSPSVEDQNWVAEKRRQAEQASPGTESRVAEKRRQAEQASPGTESNKRPIVIHPTSRWMFKTCPSERIAQLINALQDAYDRPIVLTSGPDGREMRYIESLKRHLHGPVTDLTGQLSLSELGALIQSARLFIGVDSAPMHMAAALRTPMVALFGPSNETDWGPFGYPDSVVAMNTFTCRPCQIDGCGGSKVSECLRELPVEQIMNAVRSRLTAE